MDQSKAVLASDQQVRATALTWALQAHNHKDGWPPEVITQARQFYRFLSGADPVLDLGVPEEGYETEEGGGQVIYLSEVGQRGRTNEDE